MTAQLVCIDLWLHTNSDFTLCQGSFPFPLVHGYLHSILSCRIDNKQMVTPIYVLIGWSQAGLVPRPHPTHITSSIMCVALKVICARVGLGIITTRQLSHEYVEKF